MRILASNPKLTKRLPEYMMYLFVIYTLYIQYKGFEISNAVTILGAATLGLVLFYMLATKFNVVTILTKEVLLFFTFYGVTFFTGLLNSPDPLVHINRWIESLLYFLLSICVIYISKTHGGLERLVVFFCLFALLCAVTLFIDPVLYRETSVVTNIRYSLSTKLNVNTLGTYFSLGCWCMLFLWTFHKKLRFIGIAYLVVMLFAINLTGSRKNFIAMFLIVFAWLFLVKFRENKKNIAKWLLIVIAVAVALYFIITRVLAGSTMALRMQELIQNLTSNSQEYKRIVMYRRGWELFKKNPLFGVGFYGYACYFGGYSHTTIMEVLSCTGLVGAVLYFGMYVYSILKVIKLIRLTNRNEELYRANMLLRLALILWVGLVFLAVGLIHIYLVVSFLSFGILFATISKAEQMIRAGNCGEE